MYNVIQLSNPVYTESGEQIFTEAVFSGGKAKVAPIVEKIQKIKDLLDSMVKDHEKADKKNEDESNGKRFDPKVFWKSTLFKELEDEIEKVFGFRTVNIEPFNERYDSSTGQFETKILNAMIWSKDRYPIDGLVTDQGFYDKSRSISIDIAVTVGLIKYLTAEEIMAILLHEFGHGIDPALVDIRYTETNILSKYLTDRKGNLTKDEKRFLSSSRIGMPIVFIPIGIMLNAIGDAVIKIFHLEDAVAKRKLNKIHKAIANDKDRFTRQEFAEAFADNFARMYGYGPQLISGLKKMSQNIEQLTESFYKRERKRQDMIISMTKDSLKDEHKTDIHRARALIKEYEADIRDQSINATVRKQLQDDLTELQKILDSYTNSFSDFQNRVNRIINEELQMIDLKDSDEVDPKVQEKAIKEGFIFVDDDEYITESKRGWEKLMKARKSLNPSERSEVLKKFGKTGCSFGKDKKGYYCFTHRCRSKSYPTINDIPQKDVDFVDSTC